MRRRILCLVGTRPEAIKMAPVVLALRERATLDVTVLGTGQHREMAGQVLQAFGLAADSDLGVSSDGQGLAQLSSEMLRRLDDYLELNPHDMLLVQGDTSSVFVGALAAFYRRLPVGHVEAGLRTHHRHSPFPEEMNRALTARLADIHFAPTTRARENLLAEGIAAAAIHVTGNTVIDAVRMVAERQPMPAVPLDPDRALVLVTMHRRENIGAPIAAACRALRRLVAQHANLQVVVAVHPNPLVQGPVTAALSDLRQVQLLPPQDYGGMVALMQRARLILTDSGGLQEEAPALGKPVLVLRSETERPEIIEAGVARLVGMDEDRIFAEADRLLTDAAAYQGMARAVLPYGDGTAAVTIARLCDEFVCGR